MEKNDLLPAALLNKLEAYCARGEHCPSQIRRKIILEGGSEEMAEQIIEQLKKEGFINTTRFCQAYVHDKVLYQSWGRFKIRMMLQALELPEKDIADAILAIDLNQYNKNLTKLVEAQRTKTREQKIRYLLQRGFTYEDINSIEL